MIPISSHTNKNFHPRASDIVDVALLAILTEFCTAKNAVIIIHKNKKFIKESFSLPPK
jgi:hypothetical protein